MKKQMENDMETGVYGLGHSEFRVILGLYRNNGKENGNYYLGLRVKGYSPH